MTQVEELFAEIDKLKAELSNLQDEVCAAIDVIPDAVLVREGGATENLAASLAVSVVQMVKELSTIKAKNKQLRGDMDALVDEKIEAVIRAEKAQEEVKWLKAENNRLGESKKAHDLLMAADSVNYFGGNGRSDGASSFQNEGPISLTNTERDQCPNIQSMTFMTLMKSLWE
jgi:outer membrane murein-binding lipoprotein Lpp